MAAQAMGQAAEALGQMAQSLADIPEAAPGPPIQEGAVAPAVAGAWNAASTAAQTQTSPSAQAAAQAVAGAAAAAASQAQSMGLGTGAGAPGAPGASSNPQTGTGLQVVDTSPSELKALGISLADWARLPGKLRDEILQAAAAEGPEEYRTLIRQYFQELAKRGAPAEEEPSD